MGWTRVFRRSGRRTNLALLAMLVGAFLTGWLSFAAATPVPATLATVSHGLFGLGVVALVPWKSAIINRASAIRLGSLGLLSLIVLCLIFGFVEVFVGFGSFAGLSPMQIHVGAAVIAVPLLTWHALRHARGQRLRRQDLSRRALLRTGLFALGVGVGYGLLEGCRALDRGLVGYPAGHRLTPARSGHHPSHHLAFR